MACVFERNDGENQPLQMHNSNNSCFHRNSNNSRAALHPGEVQPTRQKKDSILTFEILRYTTTYLNNFLFFHSHPLFQKSFFIDLFV